MAFSNETFEQQKDGLPWILLTGIHVTNLTVKLFFLKGVIYSGFLLLIC